MIKIFDKTVTSFTGLGLGNLDETITCVNKRNLDDDSYELELSYPISGRHYNDLVEDNIIYTKVNPYLETNDNHPYQAFRIYETNKTLEGIINVKAQHISYDLLGLSSGKITGTNSIGDVITKLQAQDVVVPPNFINGYTFSVIGTGYKEVGMDTISSRSVRDILVGSSDSIKETYDCEFDWDNKNIKIAKKLGSDNGVKIKYGKNMLSLDHTLNNTNVFTGVRPYYAKESSKNVTTTVTKIYEAYVDDAVDPLKVGWLKASSEATPIAWVANQLSYKISEQDSSTEAENYRGNIFTMTANSPTIFWQKFYTDTVDKNVINAKINPDASGPYTYNWFLDAANDNVIYPSELEENDIIYVPTTSARGQYETYYYKPKENTILGSVSWDELTQTPEGNVVEAEVYAEDITYAQGVYTIHKAYKFRTTKNAAVKQILDKDLYSNKTILIKTIIDTDSNWKIDDQPLSITVNGSPNSDVEQLSYNYVQYFTGSLPNNNRYIYPEEIEYRINLPSTNPDHVNGIYFSDVVYPTDLYLIPDDVNSAWSLIGKYYKHTVSQPNNNMWEHNYNCGYINYTDMQELPNYLTISTDSDTGKLVANADKIPLGDGADLGKNLVLNSHGETLKPLNPINNQYYLGSDGKYLPFVVLGPEIFKNVRYNGQYVDIVNNTYQKVFDFNAVTNKYVQKDTDTMAKLKSIVTNLFGKLKTTVSQKTSEYIDLTGSQEYGTNGIIYFGNHTSSDAYQKIASINLVNEVSSKPSTPQALYEAWQKYAEDHLKELTQPELTTTTSFIRLSDDALYSHLQTIDKISIGDIVEVMYLKLGVNIKQRITSITYDAISNKFTEIELSTPEEEEENNG